MKNLGDLINFFCSVPKNCHLDLLLCLAATSESKNLLRTLDVVLTGQIPKEIKYIPILEYISSSHINWFYEGYQDAVYEFCDQIEVRKKN